MMLFIGKVLGGIFDNQGNTKNGTKGHSSKACYVVFWCLYSLFLCSDDQLTYKQSCCFGSRQQKYQNFQDSGPDGPRGTSKGKEGPQTGVASRINVLPCQGNNFEMVSVLYKLVHCKDTLQMRGKLKKSQRLMILRT